MQKQNWKATPHWEAWLFSLKVWAGALLLFSMLGLAAWWMFSPIRPADPLKLWGTVPLESGLPGVLLGVWMRWDGIHYLRIASEGYSQDLLTAFFPLYPLLGRWAGAVLGGSELAGLLLVSRFALLGSLYFLYRIVKVCFDAETAKKTLVFSVFFPTSVYLFAPYPLSLALMFSLAAVWFALQKKWLLVMLAGFLAGLTHGTVLPLAAGLAVIAIQQVCKQWRHWPILLAAGSPVLGTAVFLAWRIWAGFPDYGWLLAHYWFRVTQAPWMIVEDFKRFYWGYMGHADGWVNLILLLTAVGLTIWSVRKLPMALWIYQLTGLLFLCSTAVLNTPFGSTGRYLLLMFPLFIEMALIARRRISRLLILAVSLFSSLFLAMVYFMWGWLA